MCIHVYVYIYIERERDTDRSVWAALFPLRHEGDSQCWLGLTWPNQVHVCSRSYDTTDLFSLLLRRLRRCLTTAGARPFGCLYNVLPDSGALNSCMHTFPETNDGLTMVCSRRVGLGRSLAKGPCGSPGGSEVCVLFVQRGIGRGIPLGCRALGGLGSNGRQGTAGGLLCADGGACADSKFPEQR